MHCKLLFPILLFISLNTNSQVAYITTPENLRAREWFQDSKFGMFIHRDVYSVHGDGEWVMNNQRIDKQTYQKLPAFVLHDRNKTEIQAGCLWDCHIYS